jgi:hypothetical protein
MAEKQYDSPEELLAAIRLTDDMSASKKLVEEVRRRTRAENPGDFSELNVLMVFSQLEVLRRLS